MKFLRNLMSTRDVLLSPESPNERDGDRKNYTGTLSDLVEEGISEVFGTADDFKRYMSNGLRRGYKLRFVTRDIMDQAHELGLVEGYNPDTGELTGLQDLQDSYGPRTDKSWGTPQRSRSTNDRDTIDSHIRNQLAPSRISDSSAPRFTPSPSELNAQADRFYGRK